MVLKRTTKREGTEQLSSAETARIRLMLITRIDRLNDKRWVSREQMFMARFWDALTLSAWRIAG